MNSTSSNYSPNIRIYLELDQQIIRLSDVLYNSATLYEEVEVAPGARGQLVMEVDGNRQAQDVSLDNGISRGDTKISFSYEDANVLNGRLLFDLSETSTC
ncbi:hypothetical protein MRY87_06600 [bacterium]|nr:hypothetical protein [bacterium]